MQRGCEMKIAFYKGSRPGFNGLFDAAVRWWTAGPYSHVEVIFADGLAATSSARDGGVRYKAIEFLAERWDFIDLDPALEPEARAWFDQHLGRKYDHAGLFGFAWRPVYGSDSRFFCSEAVAAALGLSDPWRFCPNTLHAVVARIGT